MHYKYATLKNGRNVEYAIQGPNGLYSTGTAYDTTCEKYQEKLQKTCDRLNTERSGKFASVYNNRRSNKK